MPSCSPSCSPNFLLCGEMAESLEEAFDSFVLTICAETDQDSRTDALARCTSETEREERMSTSLVEMITLGSHAKLVDSAWVDQATCVVIGAVTGAGYIPVRLKTGASLLVRPIHLRPRATTGWHDLATELHALILSFLVTDERTVVLRRSHPGWYGPGSMSFALNVSGLALVVASPTPGWLCACEGVDKCLLDLVRGSAFDTVWQRLCALEYPLAGHRNRATYAAWRGLEFGPALHCVKGAEPGGPEKEKLAGGSVLVHVHQPQLLGPPKLITAFEQPLRVIYDEDAVTLMPHVYKPPADGAPPADVYKQPLREECRADISIAHMSGQETTVGYPPPAYAAPFPPLAGDITLITCDGKLIRLGTFDFSSPYNFDATQAPQLSRADGWAQDTSDYPDGRSLHSTSVNGPSHSSGFFLSCSMGVTFRNAFVRSGPDWYWCDQLPGGFVQSFDLNVHQSAPCSRHIPPEQRPDPGDAPWYQLDAAAADMHLSCVTAWILDQERASSVEVEDRPLRRAVRRFRRPVSGS